MGRHTSRGRSYGGRHCHKPSATRTSHREANAKRTAQARVQLNRSATIHAALAMATAGPSTGINAFSIAPSISSPRRGDAHAARSAAARDLAARGATHTARSRRKTSPVTRLLKVSKARLLVAVSTLLTISSLAVAGSWAAWTAADSNGSNTFTTSTVLLADNQGGQAGSASTSGTAMFNVTNLNPGSAATTKCIGVKVVSGTATGMTLAATLGGAGQATLQGELTLDDALYAAGSTSTTPGSNTNNGSCASYPGGGTTIGSQGATLAAWSGAGPYAVSTTSEVWYKFTVSGLPSGDTNCATYCSKTITIAFTWTLTAT